MQIVPHQSKSSRAPLAILAVALSMGIVADRWLRIPPEISVTFCALTAVALLPALLNNRRKTATVFLVASTLIAGAALAGIEDRSVSGNRLKRLLESGSIIAGERVELTGVVTGPSETASEKLYFTIYVKQVKFREKVLNGVGFVALVGQLRTATDIAKYGQLELVHGSRIRVTTRLRRGDEYRNPGVPSLTEYLDRKGYDATGFVENPLMIERLVDESVFPPLAWLYQWRADLQQRIDRLFPPLTASVLDAALLGNRHGLSGSTTERFRAGGTFHVLVISGLHISFIGGVIFLIARRLAKKRGLQFLLATVVLWCYALAVGAGASVVRAAIMFTMIALGPVVFRRSSTLNALGGAALVLLIWRPQDIFEPSFQLTFLSVMAIVVVAWPFLQTLSAIGSWRLSRQTPAPPSCGRPLRSFCECLFWSEKQWRKETDRSVFRYRLFKAPLAAKLERYRVQAALRYGFGAIVLSSSVQLVSLPLLIVYFHRLSLASIFLNIGVSLLMAALGIVALGALLVAQASAWLAMPLISLADALNGLMVHSVDPFLQLRLDSLRLPHYSGKAAIVYVLYYVPLWLSALALSRWNPFLPHSRRGTSTLAKITIPAQVLFVAVLVLHPFSVPRADGKLHVDFLDVGQGDSALLTMPDGTTILVDGGGRPNFSTTGPVAGDEDSLSGYESSDIGETVVSACLWAKGLDHVDYILATHADADHIDGLNAVARNFRVRAAFVARVPDADSEFRHFARTLLNQRIPLALIGSGDVLRCGDVAISVLWPPANADPRAPSRNNDSVVLRVEFGQTAILLTGDIERAAENAIVDAGTVLRADVVKVAHHGSKTSSTEKFIAATRPGFAIISVGRHSPFGHPHHEPVERWQKSGAEVLTTGRSGTITVITDGQKVQVKSFVPD